MFTAGHSSHDRAGQLAPQPNPPGFKAKAAAHSSLAVCFVASVWFAALVTSAASVFTYVRSSELGWVTPAVRLSPAYHGTARPEVVAFERRGTADAP